MIPEPYDDPKVVGTPAWWLKRLSDKLAARQPRLERYEAYYSGRHSLAFAEPKFEQFFGQRFRNLHDNWCELVVSAVEERLDVQGFRIPTESTKPPNSRDEPTTADEAISGDRDAWDMWQRNGLDVMSHMAHEESLINGEASALVWPGPDGKARITIEHPSQMICEPDPEVPLATRAALKKWVDDDGYVLATLYLPEALFKFRSDRPTYTVDGGRRLAQTARFVQRETPEEPWPLPNKLGQVPVVPLENRPRLLAPSVSEIDQVIPLQQVVNKFLADMMVASSYQSWRQRAISGIQIPKDPQTNEPLPDFLSKLVEKVWLFEGNANFWESGQVDLSQHVAAIAMCIQHIASRSKTPVHYFLDPSGNYPSGESLKSAEVPLIAKARRKMLVLGERHEQIIRLGFAVENDLRAKVYSSETIWRNPETRSEAVTADAAVKWSQVGVPMEMIWEYLGLSPQQRERARILLQSVQSNGPEPVLAGVTGG